MVPGFFFEFWIYLLRLGKWDPEKCTSESHLASYCIHIFERFLQLWFLMQVWLLTLACIYLTYIGKVPAADDWTPGWTEYSYLRSRAYDLTLNLRPVSNRLLRDLSKYPEKRPKKFCSWISLKSFQGKKSECFSFCIITRSSNR